MGEVKKLHRLKEFRKPTPNLFFQQLRISTTNLFHLKNRSNCVEK